MKRLFSILLALCLLLPFAPKARAEGAVFLAPGELPQAVRDYFSTAAFTGCVIPAGAAASQEAVVNGVSHSYVFVVVRKENVNKLYGFRDSGDGRGYRYYLITENALPQGNGALRLQAMDGVWYLEDTALNLGPSFLISYTDPSQEEISEAALAFEINEKGVWNARFAAWAGSQCDAILSNDSARYYAYGEYKGTAYGVLETELRYFSWDAFPKSLQEAREKLTNPPAIPAGELTAQRIKFTGGQKFEVYSGPGIGYERAAGGKAAVSTNDWIQVFGSENGFIMIQYDLSADQNRVGYITETALPASAKVSPLRFDYADAHIKTGAYLTDDPLNSRVSVRYLQAGQSGVKWLAVMGEWVYVEVEGSGMPIRGFVPAAAIEKDAGGRAYTAVFSSSQYTARAAMTVGADGKAAITVTVEGPAAWQVSGADHVAGYRLYANNLPVNAAFGAVPDASASAWRCVFSAETTLPANATVFALLPVYETSGVHTEETMLLYEAAETK